VFVSQKTFTCMLNTFVCISFGLHFQNNVGFRNVDYIIIKGMSSFISNEWKSFNDFRAPYPTSTSFLKIWIVIS
jgi:hypothetical protein